MSGRKIILAISGAIVVVCAAAFFVSTRVIARGSGCDHIAGSSASSPDGEWVATSAGAACPMGFLSVTNYSVSVTLGHPNTKSDVIFELTDAGEPPTLTWASSHELVVKLNDPGEVQTSRHESGGVKISYVVPSWIWSNTAAIEADQAREESQTRKLYKEGKISEGDLRESIETIDASAKARSGFRQWITDNATTEGAPR